MPILQLLFLILAGFTALGASAFVYFYPWERYEVMKKRSKLEYFTPHLIFLGFVVAGITFAALFHFTASKFQ